MSATQPDRPAAQILAISASGALPAPPIAKAGVVGAIAAVGYELVGELGGEWLGKVFDDLGEHLRGAH
ncbi:MAG: hypothetical protein M3Q30_19065 [Actinomycetota bacterium]|nr:hypothetical protein [Actinomycetota bacterium]